MNPTGANFPQDTASQLSEAEHRGLMSRVTWRIVPLLFFCYIIAYIDRINVGFAKLHLQEVLGVDPKIFSSVYGFGAGLFFIGYFLFEVPSNLILQRVGARIWIARIMIFWGLVSMAFMFMKGVGMFYAMRFLLGIAEAGFFPGILLYFTYWYPARDRARIVALFALGGVVAGVIGSPISGALLHMDGILGLFGWQWLFLLEGLPAVLLGLVVLVFLPNGPGGAKWLTEGEKAVIQTTLAQDPARSDPHGRHSLGEVFTSGTVWLLCLIYFLLNVGSYGFEMWLPTIVKGVSGQSDIGVGLINAIPYLAASVAMLLVGRHSDKVAERRGHIALSAISAAVGFVIAAFASNPFIAMAGLAFAFAGLKSTLGPFWAFSTAFLSGTAAAGGIAWINSVGNLGGFVGPYIVGMIKDKTGASNLIALLLLGGALFAMGVLAWMLPKSKSEQIKAVKD